MNERIKKVKLKGNETFNFREGWLRKGMRNVEENSRVFSGKDAMEKSGVGSKMVKAIRYWLQAAGLCYELYGTGGRAREQFVSDDFGKIVVDYDPYFDDLFTLYLIHYNIVTNKELCVAWSIFFNEFGGHDFTREDFFEMCKSSLNKKMVEGATFAETSLYSDCSSVIRMYLPSDEMCDPEESTECPLTELGLLEKNESSKGTLNKSTPGREKLDKLAVFYVMLDQINKSGKNSISIDRLLNEENNIGKVFNLSRGQINDYLDQLRIAGYLVLNRTAGLDMVYVENVRPAKAIMVDYYTNVIYFFKSTFYCFKTIACRIVKNVLMRYTGKMYLPATASCGRFRQILYYFKIQHLTFIQIGFKKFAELIKQNVNSCIFSL